MLLDCVLNCAIFSSINLFHTDFLIQKGAKNEDDWQKVLTPLNPSDECVYS